MLLAKYFLEEFRKEFSKDISGFREDTCKTLESYAFPGNVRELRNIIERATLLETTSLIRPSSLPEELKKAAEIDIVSYNPVEKRPWQMPDFSFKEYIDSVEKKIVSEVMSEADGKKSKAAEMLGLTRFALRHQLKKHDLDS
jgi:transcriptional regulator with PAS, ATPase and Fis domain